MLRTAAIFVVLGTRLASADSEEPKSPGVALALSAGGAAASIGLIAAGIDGASGRDAWIAVGIGSVITPSFGEWYTGKFLTVGLGLRLAGTISTVAGVSTLDPCPFDFLRTKPCHANNSGPLALIGLGLASYATGLIWDVASAPSAARAWNARHHPPVITPSIVTSPSGRTAAGLGVGGRF